ncbi:MAG TPA: VacJ family lipoprotein [Burkholderiales bacterium]|nr:VacJ family lipoprotein [Burkholderiales bacterium]
MNPAFARFRALLAGAAAALALLGGCASTGNPRDPLEPINRGIYTFNDALDTTVLRPAAVLYHGMVPGVVRTGVHNVFSNINDVIVALNNLLQGKFTSAASDTGRILVNTTIGLLGIFDVATHFGLEKHDEDFGQTLGYWGVADGPYIVLPIFGPSNVRDSFGLVVDVFTDPVTYIDPTRDRNIVWGVRAVNRRSELLDASNILETAALDKYQFVRDAYLQRRRNLIYDGNPPKQKDEETDSQPRSEQRDEGRRSSEADGWSGSILVSGEPPTPAELEALEKQARAAQPLVGPEPQRHSVRVVRFWLPQRR